MEAPSARGQRLPFTRPVCVQTQHARKAVAPMRGMSRPSDGEQQKRLHRSALTRPNPGHKGSASGLTTAESIAIVPWKSKNGSLLLCLRKVVSRFCLPDVGKKPKDPNPNLNKP